MVKRKSLPIKESSKTKTISERTVSVNSLSPTKKKRKIGMTKILRNIKHLQRTTNLLIPRAPFLRVIREIIMVHTDETMRITTMAVEALREAAESYLVGTMEDAYQLAVHAKRVTLMPRDIQLIVSLRRQMHNN